MSKGQRNSLDSEPLVIAFTGFYLFAVCGLVWVEYVHRQIEHEHDQEVLGMLTITFFCQ
jgi:hypothetical protein